MRLFGECVIKVIGEGAVRLVLGWIKTRSIVPQATIGMGLDKPAVARAGGLRRRSWRPISRGKDDGIKDYVSIMFRTGVIFEI